MPHSPDLTTLRGYEAAMTDWWRCPSCGKRLGEVVGDRIIVRIGRNHYSFDASTAVAVCSKCGTLSMRDETVDSDSVS